ncbi:iron-containing alcohol dehydrogenase [Microbulbifer taiwanensis]|uniref:Iron-containing alcohol dehydrogenase n=1 Tax=Microbulbifer taiwanensis TaxID=986746 RepID=A0ABW1YQ95_9GAMM|nr:iron-containing alcohol dehydrogenase [Microbulbifer taiwanensis]
MDQNTLQANWNYPTSIRVGAGRVRELPAACRELGIRAPLLVTDPGLAALPMVSETTEHCRQQGLRCGLFSSIKGNPTGTNVTDGVECYRAGKHDGVVAFGGGSALDAGKAIALMAGQTRPLWNFEDLGDNWQRVDEQGMAPVIAVPTTAGTGSEVGRASVITDEERQVKRIIFHPKMLPALVILDPQLTVGLPANITAATGMDALSHSLEAFCAPTFHPMAEGIACEAIRMIREYLPRVVQNGQDLEARTQMLVASTMGATAFQRGLGAMHALAHPLGALYDKHHGLLNAILMPYVLTANRRQIEVPITRLCHYLQLQEATFDSFLSWILEIRRQLSIPDNLGEIGIGAEQSDRVGEMAFADASAATNPITFNQSQYSELFRAAVAGKLQLETLADYPVAIG